jgi:hypothetical protein
MSVKREDLGKSKKRPRLRSKILLCDSTRQSISLVFARRTDGCFVETSANPRPKAVRHAMLRLLLDLRSHLSYEAMAARAERN